MGWAALYWLSWFFGGFLIVEVASAVKNWHNTLSAQVWLFLGVPHWGVTHYTFAVLSGIFFIWAWTHLNFAVLPGK